MTHHGHVLLEATTAAPGAARRFIAGLADGVPDAVFLLVSEVVTNAVLHGRSTSGDQLRVAVVLGEKVVRVEVTNPGTAQDVRPQCPDVLDEGGRGLHLVDLLAAAWGSTCAETPTGPATTVWFEVPR